MNDQRFERLFEAARESAHEYRDALRGGAGPVVDLQLYLAKREGASDRAKKAQGQYQHVLDLLELESTPAQWAKVLDAIEAGWPAP